MDERCWSEVRCRAVGFASVECEWRLVKSRQVGSYWAWDVRVVERDELGGMWGQGSGKAG